MTFNDIFAWSESFCIKFCTFIGNLYPHVYQFSFIYLNFTTSTHHFYGFKFQCSAISLLCKNAECQLTGNDVIVFVTKCLMFLFCKEMIVWCLHRLLFYEVFKLIVHTNGKVVLGNKQHIHTFRDQGLGAKAIISSYPDHKGWKLSFVKKVCSRVDSTGQ